MITLRESLAPRGLSLWTVAAVVSVATVLGTDSPAQAATRLAQIKFKGAVVETTDEFGQLLSLSASKPETLRGLTERIKKAAEDGRVDGLLVVFQGLGAGSAQAEELRAALMAFRKSGKKVYAYGESLDMLEYTIATAGDHIVMLPGGDLDLRGIMAELTHYKGLLDMVGVEADFVRSGKYKSAVEPMIAKQPSPATLEMMNRILDDLYETMTGYIAEGRKMPVADIKKLIDAGPYTSEKALKAKLIDRTTDLESFKKALKNEIGGELSILEDYGVKKAAGLDVDFDSPLALLKLFGKLLSGSGTKEQPVDRTAKIALIYAEGAIQSGESGSGFMTGPTLGSETFNEAVRTARNDDTVKAIVVRIDSPGGSSLASEAMYRELKLAAEKKRLIISMGNTAASGGYYIAAAGETIVAEPTTITGSIGVFGGKMVTAGVYGKLDVGVTELKRGTNAGIFSSNTKFSDAERALIEDMIKDVYDTFLDRVAAGRNMDKAAVDRLGQGRVWTGLAAKQVGLVDELGGLDRALQLAADKAGLKDYKLLVLPKAKNPFDELLGGLFGGARTRTAARATTGIMAAVAANPQLQSVLAALPPRAARPVRQVLSQMQLLERERVLMAMPVIFEIK